jgi:cytochrome c oxidase cbb3-type subunit 3
MGKFRWTVLIIALVIVVVLIAAVSLIRMPGSPPSPTQAANGYNGVISASALLRVPVTGIYPGGKPAGLNPNLKNPLADDPDAAARGAKDFDAFNCSGCHMARGGGGMGPALSDNAWIYRSSPANIYLTIAQGRSAGMPAFGAMLPDRTIWELVSYIQNLSADTEQVPAGKNDSDKPWQFTEPMPPNGEKPG